MLGFDVLVYYFDEKGERRDLASWSAERMDWIDELVTEKRAVLVEWNAGYPLLYEVVASEVLPMLLNSDREALNQQISRKFAVFPWNSGIPLAQDGASINDDAIAACPEDARITVEAWDQS